jgi:hypothetical protein
MRCPRCITGLLFMEQAQDLCCEIFQHWCINCGYRKEIDHVPQPKKIHPLAKPAI